MMIDHFWKHRDPGAVDYVAKKYRTVLVRMYKHVDMIPC